jgi:hypothetical protein
MQLLKDLGSKAVDSLLAWPKEDNTKGPKKNLKKLQQEAVDFGIKC